MHVVGPIHESLAVGIDERPGVVVLQVGIYEGPEVVGSYEMRGMRGKGR
jgi:hypothetical protein